MNTMGKERVLLSGTFNPLHWGHESLLGVGSFMTKLPPFFEMSVRHWEKGNIGWKEIVDRQLQFQNKSPLILTDAPYYHEKAELLPNSVFVMGYDSVQVTLDHTAGDFTLETFERTNCSILVAGRQVDGEYKSYKDLVIPERFKDLFQVVPESLFKDPGVSSTKLRALEV